MFFFQISINTNQEHSIQFLIKIYPFLQIYFTANLFMKNLIFVGFLVSIQEMVWLSKTYR